MPFMTCPTCAHTDHATGVEEMPCTRRGCVGIMAANPPRPVAPDAFGPRHLAERAAAERARQQARDVDQQAANSSGVSVNDSLDGRTVLPAAARAALATPVLPPLTRPDLGGPFDGAGRSWQRPPDGGPSPAGAALVEACNARCAAEEATALPPPPDRVRAEVTAMSPATISIEVTDGVVDVREVSDDGSQPVVAFRDGLRAADLFVAQIVETMKAGARRATGTIAATFDDAAQEDIRAHAVGMAITAANAATGAELDTIGAQLLVEPRGPHEDDQPFRKRIMAAAAVLEYPSITLGDVMEAAEPVNCGTRTQPWPSRGDEGNAARVPDTYEDGLRAGCLAALEQVNAIMDQIVEVADLCCEPDRPLGDPGEHQRAALIADVVRVVRRRMQDVGV